MSKRRTTPAATPSPFNAELFAALGLDELIPAPLAHWRPLVADGLRFFLERLPAQRLMAIVAEQMLLGAAPQATAALRLVALLICCPTLHKLGQVLARRPELHPDLRRRLQALFDAGRHDEVRALLGANGISAAECKAMESVHPMFLGGNYLPDTERGEVEIARVSLASVTGDVTCVYARPADGGIHYRGRRVRRRYPARSRRGVERGAHDARRIHGFLPARVAADRGAGNELRR